MTTHEASDLLAAWYVWARKPNSDSVMQGSLNANAEVEWRGPIARIESGMRALYGQERVTYCALVADAMYEARRDGGRLAFFLRLARAEGCDMNGIEDAPINVFANMGAAFVAGYCTALKGDG